ncbi:CRISPR-associated protein Cas4 [Ignisphaera sp. 4213-co]|uniref:CRISPR-associated exonuclease Cas4 n=1 Tax=Ignisphaera cupida TaxID=3050454 RepID=A0ABD4ZAH6_9CREN|nr:CRISPR-associated protein Cas4 [Ignisphaera sp. 4213-co]MDK6029305.1 CRISPR-associated protein Cas4 [Ignisphaera sp. 4213-co]
MSKTLSFDIINLIYNWRVEESRKRLEEKLENEIYVTDLIYCPLKYHYQKKYKEIVIANAFDPVTIFGELIHLGVGKLLSNLLGSNNVELEKEYEKEIVVDGTTYIVKGRVDAIIGDWLIEIKSSKSDLNIPHQHHILQTRLYLWLTGLKKAILLYITQNRVAEYVVEEPVSDGEVSDLIRSIIAKSPAPRYSWECSYCPFSTLCPSKKTS